MDSAPPATQLLQRGSDYREQTTDDGHITIAIQLSNDSDRELTVTGPIRLLGSNGKPMQHTDGRITGWSNQIPAETTPTLTTIKPHQQVSLVITAQVDCRSNTTLSDWPVNYPIVVIPLAGYKPRWERPLSDLISAHQGETLYTRACPAAG